MVFHCVERISFDNRNVNRLQVAENCRGLCVPFSDSKKLTIHFELTMLFLLVPLLSLLESTRTLSGD